VLADVAGAVLDDHLSMSMGMRPALSAIAFQCAAALEAYVERFESLGKEPLDSRQCASVGEDLDQVRLLAGAFPELAADMVELMLCHSECVYHLLSAVTLIPAQFEDLKERHARAAARLQTKCRRHFSLNARS
jgi:hypothetical protein